jgi:hypothetical protein
MDADPGWTCEQQWQYGTPAYASAGPTNGFTGTRILGYNLSGDYPNNLSVQYATPPPIHAAGSTALTLRFKRWLRLRQNDTASIQVSTNGTTWSAVWSTSSVVADTVWQDVQYPLPAGGAGSSSIWLRWGLASNNSQTDIGWNLDDVELLAYGITAGVLPIGILLTWNPLTQQIQLTLQGQPYQTYVIEASADLVQWSPMVTNTAGSDGRFTCLDLEAAHLPKRFYRGKPD